MPLAQVDSGPDEVEAVARVMRSQWLTMGPITENFEARFARFHNTKHALAVSSGTAALHLAYLAIGLSAGDEVIMPSLTFVATASAAVACGARPVFAEVISDDEPTIDPDHVAALITQRTRAITVVHYAGYACRMDEIKAVADQHRLAVIEDCAHAPGVRYGDRYIGTVGTLGCFSFFSNKNMTTAEGGMVLTESDELASRIRSLRCHGMSSGTWDRYTGRPPGYDVVDFGWNYRIDEIRSALGLVQLSKLEGNNSRRCELMRRYREQLSRSPDVQIPFKAYHGRSAYHILPLLLGKQVERERLVSGLTQAGIQTSHHYVPIHQLHAYRERYGYEPGILPRTDSFARREVTLPLYSSMQDSDVDYVAEAVNRLMAASA